MTEKLQNKQLAINRLPNNDLYDMLLIIRIILSLLFLSNYAFANDSSNNETKESGTGKFSAELAAGVNFRTGNKEETEYSGDNKLSYIYKKWDHNLAIKFHQHEIDDKREDEKYHAGWQSRYDLSEVLAKDSYVFGLASFIKDRYGSYDEQISERIGLGYKIINRENLLVETEIATGMNHRKQDKNDDYENLLSADLGANLKWHITKSVIFDESALISFDKDLTKITNNAKLEWLFDNSWSIMLSNEIEYYSNVDPDDKKYDSTTSLMLKYRFTQDW